MNNSQEDCDAAEFVLEQLDAAQPRPGDEEDGSEADNEEYKQRAIKVERRRYKEVRARLQADVVHGVPVANEFLGVALGRLATFFRTTATMTSLASPRRGTTMGIPLNSHPIALGAIALGIAALTACSPVSADQTAASDVETAEVIAVVDGDTIDIANEGEPARVRMIGIDTPEIGRDGETGECYANEARDYLNSLLYGQTVELRSDPTQADTDTYGRQLRHVIIDGQSAALLALEAGAGHEYTYNDLYAGHQAHVDAEEAATANRAGIWAACA